MKSYQVKFRALEPEDLDDLYTIENNSDTWDVGITNVPYSRYALHDYISNNAYDLYQDRQVRMVITNDREELVGLLDIMNYEPRHHRAEVGILIKSSYRRRGYALDALLRLDRYARDVWNLHQLYAVISSKNPPALALFIKAGFVNKATLPQWLCEGSTYYEALFLQKVLS